MVHSRCSRWAGGARRCRGGQAAAPWGRTCAQCAATSSRSARQHRDHRSRSARPAVAARSGRRGAVEQAAVLLCRETAESVLAWDHDLPCHWRAGCPETGTAPTGCPRLQGNLAAPADLDAVARRAQHQTPQDPRPRRRVGYPRRRWSTFPRSLGSSPCPGGVAHRDHRPRLRHLTPPRRRQPGALRAPAAGLYGQTTQTPAMGRAAQSGQAVRIIS
jgi:hypothetical protein